MPEYERAALRQKKGSKLDMDNLNFCAEEILIIEGTSYLNFPLHEITNQHYITNSSLTSVVQEIDLSVKSPILIKDSSHEIFVFSELTK